MAETGSDYHRGEMDISGQKATFQLFMGMTKWGSLYTAALVFWLSLWFCTKAGFAGATVSALVLIVLGTLLLASKPKAAH